jgi:hypothetical protein
MQTFLPYSDFSLCAAALDPKRLGNQVYCEGMILLRGKWQNHPASKMWRGYETALAYYLYQGVMELLRRGLDYQDRPWFDEIMAYPFKDPDKLIMPPWLGREEIHASHRANLLRKNPEWYGQFGWKEEPTEGYVWPV